MHACEPTCLQQTGLLMIYRYVFGHISLSVRGYVRAETTFDPAGERRRDIPAFLSGLRFKVAKEKRLTQQEYLPRQVRLI